MSPARGQTQTAQWPWSDRASIGSDSLRSWQDARAGERGRSHHTPSRAMRAAKPRVKLFTNPPTASPLPFTASQPKQKHSRAKFRQLRRLRVWGKGRWGKNISGVIQWLRYINWTIIIILLWIVSLKYIFFALTIYYTVYIHVCHKQHLNYSWQFIPCSWKRCLRFEHNFWDGFVTVYTRTTIRLPEYLQCPRKELKTHRISENK